MSTNSFQDALKDAAAAPKDDLPLTDTEAASKPATAATAATDCCGYDWSLCWYHSSSSRNSPTIKSGYSSVHVPPLMGSKVLATEVASVG